MKKTMTEWIRLARQGDEDAISYLYEQTYNSVYQSVLAIVRDEDEAMDIVQDSYIKGFQNLHKLDDPEKYQAWMKRLASNMAMDYLRKKRPALFSERVDEEGREIDLRHEDDCLEHMPEEVIDRQETARLMNEILGKLSQEQRLAVVLFYYEERSVREIAEMLDCSENTVKSRLNYGRKKIEAEVLALEKRGTKLYSLAPLPFFLWVVRMAKGYGIALETAASTAAVGAAGAAAAAGETAAAGGTAAGGTAAAATAGSSSAGTAAAGAAVKTAGTAAGKTLATKIVAGTLAATMTVGAGVTVIHNRNIEKENAAAHVVYEKLLEKHEYAYELGYDAYTDEQDRFWDEFIGSVLAKYPDDLNEALKDKYHQKIAYTRTVNYPPIGVKEMEEGILLPEAAFDPMLTDVFWWMDYCDEYQDDRGHYHRVFDSAIFYAYYDFDENGIDELVIKTISNKDLDLSTSFMYSIIEGYLVRGDISAESHNGSKFWKITQYAGHGYHYYDENYAGNYLIEIDCAHKTLGNSLFYDTYEEPQLEWKPLLGNEISDVYHESLQSMPEEQTERPVMSDEEKYELIKNMEGTYRIYGWGSINGFRPYHEVDITVTETDIVITDLGESEEVAQWRQDYTDRLIASRKKAHSPAPTDEELDKLTIANLGTMRIPIQTVAVSDTITKTAYTEVCMEFDSVSFEGGEQSILPFNRIVTVNKEDSFYIHMGNQDWNIQMKQRVVSKNGMEFTGDFQFERQANESNDNT